MSEKRISIHELFKNAIKAEIDMGIDELVLDRKTDVSLPISEPVSASTALKSETNKPFELPHTNAPATVSIAKTIIEDFEFESLNDHNQAICNCQNCPLGKTRTNFVYGVGNPKADIMFIGEAPGADEDRQGEPFVGRAGKLLNKIFEAMKLKREEVYIANILKCRPPNNRDPQPDEMNQCMPYLNAQIHLIQPKIICLLGRIAAQAILDTNTPLGKLRNQWHSFRGVPTIVTYHPAALLRFQSYKKDTWADMQALMKKYEEMKI